MRNPLHTLSPVDTVVAVDTVDIPRKTTEIYSNTQFKCICDLVGTTDTTGTTGDSVYITLLSDI